MIKSLRIPGGLTRTKPAVEAAVASPPVVMPPLLGGGVLTLDEALPLLTLEFDRARRYERPLVFLALPLEMLRCAPVTVSRTSDIIAVAADRGVLMICAPEGTPEGMLQLAHRLTDDDPSTAARAVLASLPDDGLVLDALLSAVLA